MESTALLEDSATGLGRGRLSILLATDGSEHAVKAARHLAGTLAPRHAEVRLLTVLNIELAMGEPIDADARQARIDRETEKAVGETRRLLTEAGQSTWVGTRFGYPPDEILADIEFSKPDLVVVGRRGLSRPASLLLGSVSDFLLRHKTPVLVVP